MIQITDTITNPFVIIYNVGVLLTILLWIYQDKVHLKKIITEGKLIYWYIFSFLWLIFSVLANIFVLKSDVEDAIISATKSFVNNGTNVYKYNVVTHLLNNQVVLGLYHYFPSDLLIYSTIYIFCKPIINVFPFLKDSWFVFGNALFLTIGYIFVKKIVNQVEHKRLVPVYIFVTAFFLFTNSALLVMYFTMGFYLIKKLSMHNSGITAYIFAAGVKYITGLLLFVQIIEEFMHVRKLEDLKFLEPYIIGSIIFAILIAPFGFYNMLNATFLYQLEVSKRSQLAGIYGPLLIELVLEFNLLNYFSFIFIIASIISIFISFKLGKTTYEREIILTFCFLLILPFYGTELTIVPLLLWLFKLFDVELNFPETSSYFKTKETE